MCVFMCVCVCRYASTLSNHVKDPTYRGWKVFTKLSGTDRADSFTTLFYQKKKLINPPFYKIINLHLTIFSNHYPKFSIVTLSSNNFGNLILVKSLVALKIHWKIITMLAGVMTLQTGDYTHNFRYTNAILYVYRPCKVYSCKYMLRCICIIYNLN